jgi:hypothetical protein
LFLLECCNQPLDFAALRRRRRQSRQQLARFLDGVAAPAGARP